jgi:hypothetical protein
MMAFVILFGTFYLFQVIQVQKMGDAMYGLVLNAQQSTAKTTEMLDGTLDELKEKFPESQAFLEDSVFDQSVMTDRNAKDIDIQLVGARADMEASTQGVFLYPVFKYIIPSAQSTVDHQNEKVEEFFHSEVYTKYADVDRSINDINSGIAHCHGTATEKNNFGWVGQDKTASADQKSERAKLIAEAADRTLCKDKAAFKAAHPIK